VPSSPRAFVLAVPPLRSARSFSVRALAHPPFPFLILLFGLGQPKRGRTIQLQMEGNWVFCPPFDYWPRFLGLVRNPTLFFFVCLEVTRSLS